MRPTLLTLASLSLLALSQINCSPRAKVLDSPIVDELAKGRSDGSAAFDHEDFGKILAAHVDAPAGRVDYAGLADDEAKLDAYLARIAKVDAKTLDESQQKALLINAYNGYTLKLILENYPGVKSIRDLDKPWDTARYEVAGHTLSLNDIEHGLLRPIYKDPRIHFAVNCASIGCPPLLAKPYPGDKATLDATLEEATRDTLGNKRYVVVSPDKNEVALTKLLDWYGADFTDASFQGHAASPVAYVGKYNGDVAKKIEEGDPKVTFLDYDWNLNDVK